LVDNNQTSQFQAFCEAASKFANGDERYREDVSRKQHLARQHLSEMASDMADIATDYAEFESMFTPAEIRTIRLDKPIDWSAWKKFFFLVARLAEGLHKTQPHATRWPSPEEWPNTFLYRTALFQLLHFFDWMRRGSPSKLGLDKIRNDAVDMNFGVYATYFDGLMTKDQKSLEIYNEAAFLLEDFILPASRAPG
jgi:hypothetical protein